MARATMVRKADEAWDLAMEELTIPRWKQPVTRLESFFKSLDAEGEHRFVLLNLFIGPNSSHRGVLQSLDARRDGFRIGLALTRYHHRHGTWPAELSQLVPEFMDQLPVDLINGEPLRYRLDASGPVVYSVGQNGIDGGGIWTPKTKPEAGTTTQPAATAPAASTTTAPATSPVDVDDFILWPME